MSASSKIIDAVENSMEEEEKPTWRERTTLPLNTNGVSHKNMHRLRRAVRNQGRVRSLRFNFKKGLK